jgi:hypothetical protein
MPEYQATGDGIRWYDPRLDGTQPFTDSAPRGLISLPLAACDSRRLVVESRFFLMYRKVSGYVLDVVVSGNSAGGRRNRLYEALRRMLKSDPFGVYGFALQRQFLSHRNGTAPIGCRHGLRGVVGGGHDTHHHSWHGAVQGADVPSQNGRARNHHLRRGHAEFEWEWRATPYTVNGRRGNGRANIELANARAASQ